MGIEAGAGIARGEARTGSVTQQLIILSGGPRSALRLINVNNAEGSRSPTDSDPPEAEDGPICGHQEMAGKQRTLRNANRSRNIVWKQWHRTISPARIKKYLTVRNRFR